MRTASVILAEGCEEGEALTIIDILRRCEIDVKATGLDKEEIKGAHDIVIRCDEVLSEESDPDVVILPGGYGGVDAMKESELLRRILTKRNDEGKLIAAICAAPTALDAYGLLEGKTYTCYPTVAGECRHGNCVSEKMVSDGNLITAKGPALAYAFAYKIADALGADSLSVKKRMVYFNAFDVKEDE